MKKKISFALAMLVSLSSFASLASCSEKETVTDYDKVYTTVLKDLREGYLGRVTFDRL